MTRGDSRSTASLRLITRTESFGKQTDPQVTITRTECNRSRLASLKLPSALVLAVAIVVLRQLCDSELEVLGELVHCCVTYVTEQ